jgi:hypothetical protein
VSLTARSTSKRRFCLVSLPFCMSKSLTISSAPSEFYLEVYHPRSQLPTRLGSVLTSGFTVSTDDKDIVYLRSILLTNEKSASFSGVSASIYASRRDSQSSAPIFAAHNTWTWGQLVRAHTTAKTNLLPQTAGRLQTHQSSHLHAAARSVAPRRVGFLALRNRLYQIW